MLASKGGRTESVKVLIDAGADITLRNKVSPWNYYFLLWIPSHVLG